MSSSFLLTCSRYLSKIPASFQWWPRTGSSLYPLGLHSPRLLLLLAAGSQLMKALNSPLGSPPWLENRKAASPTEREKEEKWPWENIIKFHSRWHALPAISSERRWLKGHSVSDDDDPLTSRRKVKGAIQCTEEHPVPKKRRLKNRCSCS